MVASIILGYIAGGLLLILAAVLAQILCFASIAGLLVLLVVSRDKLLRYFSAASFAAAAGFAYCIASTDKFVGIWVLDFLIYFAGFSVPLWISIAFLGMARRRSGYSQALDH